MDSMHIELPDDFKLGPARAISIYYQPERTTFVLVPDVSLVNTGESWISSIEPMVTMKWKIPLGVECYNARFTKCSKHPFMIYLLVLATALMDIGMYLKRGTWKNVWYTLRILFITVAVLFVIQPTYFIFWHIRAVMR